MPAALAATFRTCLIPILVLLSIMKSVLKDTSLRSSELKVKKWVFWAKKSKGELYNPQSRMKKNVLDFKSKLIKITKFSESFNPRVIYQFFVLDKSLGMSSLFLELKQNERKRTFSGSKDPAGAGCYYLWPYICAWFSRILLKRF